MLELLDMKKILAIETSCDETAASIIKVEENSENFEIEIISNVVASQIDIHKKWGGVFPELASRAHLETMIPVLIEGLGSDLANISSVDSIAVTQGPGLIGSLLMGTEAANILSRIYDKAIIPINHLEGHIYAAFASKDQETKFRIPQNDIFPILALVVSGGHTSLILMKNHLEYDVIGQTIDDAAGEAFDKVSKILDLGYPGGPIIEKLAQSGDENSIKFSIGIPNSLDFSFSGLKTAVLYKTKNPSTGEQLEFDQADLAASFQKTVVDTLILKTKKAIEKYQPKTLILSGGVSANSYLRKRFSRELSKFVPEASILIPPKNLSTDNAVGIAIAAALKQITTDYVEADPNLKLS
jgi:N6-L-threonylcarbamoyladenine synthase